ncbi:MAG: hypothetical protein V7646_887 [Pseudonocardia sp.]
MVAVVLTETDLARISVVVEPMISIEIVLSYRMLYQPRVAAYAGWRADTLARLRERGHEPSTAVLDLLLRGPDRPWAAAGTVRRLTDIDSAERDADGSRGSQQGADALRAYYLAAIAPYREDFRAAVDFERAGLARARLSNGPEGLLQAVRLSDTHAATTDVTGRPVTLVPSVFCHDGPVISEGDGAGELIVYPMSPVARSIALRDHTGPARPRALGSLLGNTRAAILRGLVQVHTTSEVAKRWRISAATASRHLSILREAGLVFSQRQGNEVHHVLSPLGQALAGDVRG